MTKEESQLTRVVSWQDELLDALLRFLVKYVGNKILDLLWKQIGARVKLEGRSHVRLRFTLQLLRLLGYSVLDILAMFMTSFFLSLPSQNQKKKTF